MKEVTTPQKALSFYYCVRVYYCMYMSLFEILELYNRCVNGVVICPTNCGYVLFSYDALGERKKLRNKPIYGMVYLPHTC